MHRLKSVLAPLVAAPTLAATVLVGGAAPAGAATLAFTTAGEHAFVVPAGNTSIHVVAVGGSGGRTADNRAGAGAVVTGDIPVAPGQRLLFVVGGNGTGRFEGVPGAGGANGGGGAGTGLSAGGGGASDVRTCGLADSSCNTLVSRLLVAGGGGGMGNGGTGNAGRGGNAGGGPGVPSPGGGSGSVGGAGGSGTVTTFAGGAGGGGGTLTAGGTGGADDIGGVAGSGTLGTGGAAQSADPYGNKGGGGGGGYYGGGAGGLSMNNASGGGGGGGSSFAAAGVANVSFALDTTRTPAIQVTFNDAPVNRAPVARNDQYTTNEDQALTVLGPSGVLANDSDPDGGPLTSALVALPAHGTLIVTDDGAFSYDPAGNYSGPDSFTYKAVDAARAESAPATVTITVNPVNDAPMAVDDVATTDEDTPVVIAVVDNDTDVDNPNSDLQIVGFASFTGGSVRVLDDRRHIEFDPQSNFNSDNRPTGFSFTYRVTDGTTGSGPSATVRITVNPVNDAPGAGNDAYTLDEDTTLSAPAPGVLDNDRDADGPGPLRAALVTGPARAAAFALQADGSFTYTPAHNFHGADSFTYKAVDGAGAESAVRTVSLTVERVDDVPPVLHLPAPITADADAAGTAVVTYTVSASDEAPVSPAVTCSPASGATFAIGTTTVNCSATDAAGNTGTGSFTVTVRDVLPPALSLPAPIKVNSVGTTGGAPAAFTATATDDDRRSPNPAVTCTPVSGATFAIGPNTVTCTSTDLSGNIGTGTFTVEVVDILPPVVSMPAPITVNATGPSGVPVTFTATATDDDRRIATPPVTCTPASGATFAIGDTLVTCTATDLYGNVGRASFSVHVRGAAEQLADTVAASQGVGPGNAISSKIERAQSDFAAGNVAKACKSVDDYMHQLEVHSGKAVPAALAAKLTADARRIQSVMGC